MVTLNRKLVTLTNNDAALQAINMNFSRKERILIRIVTRQSHPAGLYDALGSPMYHVPAVLGIPLNIQLSYTSLGNKTATTACHVNRRSPWRTKHTSWNSHYYSLQVFTCTQYLAVTQRLRPPGILHSLDLFIFIIWIMSPFHVIS